ncbi:MAG: hypothetical protein O3C62_12090 [Actinomycetota bacterium]|nr:hypothetical protein [Actinomycetota bacterium]MDA3002400.1 hypothetical protein [Actinomycetota bacterium]
MKRSTQICARRRWGRVAVVAALISGLILVLSGPTSASDDETMATDTTMAADVVDVFLSDQGVQPSDDVRDDLENEVVGAIRVGALLWETLNELGFSWSSPPTGVTSTSGPPVSFPGELLRERIRQRIEEQLRIWNFIAPEWHEVFAQLRDRIQECRENGDDSCWNELRLRLQYEHAQRFEQNFENEYRNMQTNGAMPSDLAELERLREQAEERVQSMIQEQAQRTLDEADLQLGDLERLRDQLRDQLQIHDMTSSTSSSSSTSVAPGGQQSGQGGN